jgi:ketosteroid isomerase-like protein
VEVPGHAPPMGRTEGMLCVLHERIHMPDRTNTAEGELEAAELRLQAAMLASDVEALDALLDDECVYTGPDGVAIGKAADLEAHRSGVLDVQAFDVDALTFRVLGDTGLSFVEASLRGTAGGQPFSARMRYTRTWVRTDGAWRVVAAHASARS